MSPFTRVKTLLAAGLAAGLLVSTAGVALANPLWGDYATDEDNQNNWGWGGGDGDLDGVYAATVLYGKNIINFVPPPGDKYDQAGLTYFYPFTCPSQAVAPIEFDVYIPMGELTGDGSLTIYTYWVRSGEYSYVYLNNEYLGILAPTGDRQKGSTTFTIPNTLNVISPGRNNRVTIVPATGTCTEVTGGKIHLVSPRASINGLVFEDTNRNGVHDEGEAGIPGVPLHFYPDGKDINVPLATGDDGTFGMVAAEWGDWNVEADVPAGYVPTSPTVVSFHMQDTLAWRGVNFGVAPAPTPTPTPKASPTPTATPTPT